MTPRPTPPDQIKTPPTSIGIPEGQGGAPTGEIKQQIRTFELWKCLADIITGHIVRREP
jgi:hypothetical protein